MTTEIKKPETCVKEGPVSTPPALPPREPGTSDKAEETAIPTSSAQPAVSISILDWRSLMTGTKEHASAVQLQDDTPAPAPKHCGNDAKDGTCMRKQQFEDEAARRKHLEVDLGNLQTELKQKEKELQDVRKRWKQAAKELDKTKSSQQRGLHQRTDSEVKDDVAQLRWNIRNLAFGYFGGEYKIGVKAEDLTSKTWQSLLSFLDYRLDMDINLRSGAVRPFIIQALIWDVIDTRIFHNGLWAGPVSSAFVRLIRQIAPAKPEEQSFDAEAWRKFNLWKADTASMIVNSFEATGSIESDRQRLDDRLAKISVDVVRSAGKFSSRDRPHDHDIIRREIHNILRDAVKLDESLNRQAVSFHWQFHRIVPFDGEIMSWIPGVTAEKNSLCLSVAPGLRKRGKSSGDGFESTALILPGEVFPVATREP
ncbi:hypothetical protein CMUS01_12985 [Colletotrichum musicola]|uniref:Uncharacterized protein n=1 Tax=Colletotrichum musicola TaxID=2175873 RepID=A0A8H6JGH1_9PEZI|nr:hypothetical protein CMUS01_12985 [Colletotrichum musicola]